jgi:hypothetical protein
MLLLCDGECMTYLPNIPIGSLPPASQVSQVQGNFATFASVFSSTSGGIVYNHSPMNNFNQGDHESVILQNQSVDPGVTESLAALYCKNATSAAGTQPQLFIQIPEFLPNGIPNAPMQLTYNSVNTSGPVYQSFLPGGYIFYFGSTSNIAVAITLSPTPTTILAAIAYPNNMTTGGGPVPFDGSVVVTQPGTIKINSALASGVYSFTWMAVAQA